MCLQICVTRWLHTHKCMQSKLMTNSKVMQKRRARTVKHYMSKQWAAGYLAFVLQQGMWPQDNPNNCFFFSLRGQFLKQFLRENNLHLYRIKTHTSLNSSRWATASRHSCPVLSTESVNSTNSPLRSWIRVTRQLLLETVYLRVLLSLKPNGKGMFHTSFREAIFA